MRPSKPSRSEQANEAIPFLLNPTAHHRAEANQNSDPISKEEPQDKSALTQVDPLYDNLDGMNDAITDDNEVTGNNDDGETTIVNSETKNDIARWVE